MARGGQGEQDHPAVKVVEVFAGSVDTWMSSAISLTSRQEHRSKRGVGKYALDAIDDELHPQADEQKAHDPGECVDTGFSKETTNGLRHSEDSPTCHTNEQEGSHHAAIDWQAAISIW